MTKFKKELEKFFIYFFTGVSVLVVVLGIHRIKDTDTVAVVPNDKTGKNTDDTDSGNTSQKASIFDAFKNATNKVLAATETVSAKGKAVATPWGDVVTSVKIQDGKIISVEAPSFPDSPPSLYAKPILIDESVKTGSANIQSVTGATITSNAFKASLESALAKAKTGRSLSLTASATETTSNTSKTSAHTTTTNKTTTQDTTTTTTTPTTNKVASAQETIVNTTPTAPASVSGTFVGNAVPTPWGNAVVTATLQNGLLVNVVMTSVPNSPPSQDARPILVQQALAAGSANIQGVSGATYVSNAFKASLENALSKARAQGTINAPVTNTTPITQTTTNTTQTTTQNTTTTTQATQNNPAPATPVAPVAPASVSGTFTGNAYATPWGNAIVSVTFTNGKITGVTMPSVPNSPPSQQAQPILVQQALSAGSANIQGVSGATVVSNAFKLSLESAIAKASTQGTVTTPTTTTTPAAPAPTYIPMIRYNDDD